MIDREVPYRGQPTKPKIKLCDVTNDLGVTFAVVLVPVGARYGLDDCLVNARPGTEAMVEFYDARYPHTEHGQFVSRYYASTLLAVRGGLCLDGGEPSWQVTAENLAEVRAALAKYV